MSRYSRLYYYSLLGAIGGLIGWQASNVLGLSFTSNLYLSEVGVGGLIGFFIGGGGVGRGSAAGSAPASASPADRNCGSRCWAACWAAPSVACCWNWRAPGW